MQYVVYIYSSKNNATELKPFRCPNCGRIVFKTNSTKILLSNAYGASIAEFPPNSNYIEHICHSCKAVYQILFQ